MLTDSFITQQIHRDIRWLLNSPPLMSIPAEHDATHWLHDQSHMPQQDESTVFEPDFWQHRLGFYYENLLNHILTKALQPIELKRNIQVRNKTQTLGEYDFLVRFNDTDAYHIECAVKFYLCTGDGSNLNQYEGPNRRDRLDLKWNKMINKQIRLSKTRDGREAADNLNLIPNHTLILIQGYLFYPFATPPCPQRLHPDINPKHQQGWWLRNQQLPTILEDQLRYLILNKPYWLSCPNQPESQLMTAEALSSHLEEQRHPQFVVRLEKAEEGWKEKDRGFVVQNDW